MNSQELKERLNDLGSIHNAIKGLACPETEVNEKEEALRLIRSAIYAETKSFIKSNYSSELVVSEKQKRWSIS